MGNKTAQLIEELNQQPISVNTVEKRSQVRARRRLNREIEEVISLSRDEKLVFSSEVEEVLIFGNEKNNKTREDVDIKISRKIEAEEDSEEWSIFSNISSEEFVAALSTCTVGSKIIRTLAIILGIFLWFDYQFLSFHACYKQYKT